MTEAYILYDSSFWITAASIAATAVIGIIGVANDERPEHRKRVHVLIALLCTVACLGISGDAWARIKAGIDQENLDTKLASSAQREQQLHSDNLALSQQNLKLQGRADETYAAAKDLVRRSARALTDIERTLSTTQQNLGATRKTLGTTRALGKETQRVARQATRLQVAAATSIRGIEKLASPLVNVAVDYQIDVAIDDPALRTLKAQLMLTKSKYNQQVASAKPQGGIVSIPFPIFPVTDILNNLPPLDPGTALLRSMDLAIELYRPPFPKRPYYGDSHRGRIVAASDAVDYLIETVGLTGHNIQLGFPVNRPPDLTVMVTASFVPGEPGGRSGRLDSIVDLPGSTILIHLIPDIRVWRTPGLLKATRLDGVALSINGTLHRIDLRRATIGQGPAFPYYEIKVPAGWKPSSYFIP